MKITLKSIAVLLLVSCSAQTSAAPNTEGSWTSVVDWPLIAIHSILTPQGDVFSFGTDQNGVQGAQFFYDSWDPLKGNGSASHTTLPNILNVDSFCSAAVLLPETGNVLMSGGDDRPNGNRNRGIKNSPIYNPSTGSISAGVNMNFARWYPTSTVLANGEILVSGGRDTQNRYVNTPEIYSPTNNSWRSLFGISMEGNSPVYPRQWVAPDGRIFGLMRDGVAGIERIAKMFYLDPRGNGSIQFLNNLPVRGDVYKSASAMYRPGKILHVVGESVAANLGSSMVIDINGTSPSIRAVAKPTESNRVWADTVLLPNGKVMLVGGSAADTRDVISRASYRPEIWDPATEKWSTMAASVKTRLYHSTALLLADGRILVAGGGAPGPETNTNAEIFTPPYLYNSSGGLAVRPKISSASNEAPYGAQMFVGTTASNISKISLIKTGAVTHSLNMEQRYMELRFTSTNGGLQVNIPSSENLAPPGYYLMHLIDNNGVPSKGHIVRISRSAVLQQAAYPVAVTESVSMTNNGNALSIQVLANDIGAGLSISDYNRFSANGGTITQSGNSLSYKPSASFSGTDTFWYVIKDSLGRTNSAKVTISVSGGGFTNPIPVGQPDMANATAGSTITIDVLANDVGNVLVLNAPSSAYSLRGGSVALSNNKIRYTAPLNLTGQDKLWYTFKDVQGRGSWGEVTINVSGGAVSNPFPVGKPDAASVTAGTTITIDVLANDVGNGLVLNTPSAYSSKGGGVSLSSNKIRYTPPSSFTGQDKLWYTFKDVQGRANWGEVTINVSGGTTASAPPVGNPDTATTSRGSTITIDVLANDTGSGLVINPLSSAWSLKGGKIALINNKIRYTAPSSFTGQDKVWYSFKDSQSRQNYGEVTISVN